MAPVSTQLGHGLAKGLGIKLADGTDALSRGESVFSIDTADTFVEEEPTTAEWLRDVLPNRRTFTTYFANLFPFLRWVGFYNVQWLMGDLVAGITVGAVVVPQSMAYAVLAALPPEFGLYSSFMGVLIYWFFATSKDITIGPVAVMSTIVGNIVLAAKKSNPEYEGYVIASALAVMCGVIIIFIGLIRCGWVVEFISLTAISAFMTGSAINIAVGQIPTMMGITGFSTRDATYLVFINTLKNLGLTTLDAAMGLTALAMLYLIRSICNFLSRRFPHRAKLFFFLSTLRTAFVILLYTMISWLVNKDRKKALFKILLDVPRGFQHAGVPTVTTDIIKVFINDLPASVIVLLIEHIAISKSFGRINNYVIDPSQELVAIGVTNIIGPFLGAYAATGSFSRTAIKSKAGVRTPFAGVITALIVLLAIYALTSVFYYIPSASLSAVIIHAVGDLITPPNTLYRFWRISPLEVIIFFAGVFVTVFSSIENGIYTTIISSLVVLLFRAVKARGRFLGKVRIHSVVGDHVADDAAASLRRTAKKSDVKLQERERPRSPADEITVERNLFLPLDHHDGSNPEVQVTAPHAGVFIYRFSEGFNYPNANHYLDYLTQTIMQQTRRTSVDSLGRLGDRPWNDPGPSRGKISLADDRPTLKAVILDFSSVNNVDITSVQILIDIRNQLDRYAAPHKVAWHLACINNRWTKRALASAGFGYPPVNEAQPHRYKPIFSVAEIGGAQSAAQTAELQQNKLLERQQTRDAQRTGSSSSDDRIERKFDATGAQVVVKARVAPVHGLNRPFFHLDLTSALQSALANLEHHAAADARREAHGGVDAGVLP
ncbi:MAG: Sulfate permease 2 [Trizodia sp. TS-e1964]|nr:MAG: Sulfate permease 2 [Trizodia sp. TS-e1964]